MPRAMPSKKAARKKAAKNRNNIRSIPAEQSGASAKRNARLLAATEAGHCGAMERMLDGGLDANALSKVISQNGTTTMMSALCRAVIFQHEAAVRLLLDRGANPNLADSLGCTPLMGAALKGSLPIMELLLEAKAEIDAAEPDESRTAFHTTCFHDHPDCAEALVRAGCATGLRTKTGQTGRDVAHAARSTAVLERLRSLETALASDEQEQDPEEEQGDDHDVADTEAENAQRTDKERERQAVSYKESGNQALKAGRLDDAIDCYTAAISLTPDPIFFSNRSAAFAKRAAGTAETSSTNAQDDYSAAAADAQSCIDMAPTFVKGHARKAVALEGLGRHKDAAAACAAGLEACPGNRNLYAAQPSFSTSAIHLFGLAVVTD